MTDVETKHRDRGNTSALSRTIWFASFVTVTVLLMAARIELFRTGVWYGEGTAQLLDVLISVLVACSATLGGAWLLGRHRPQPKEIARHAIEIAATLLAFAVSSYTLMGIVVPASPSTAAETACGGAPVNGAPYLAQTGSLGVNSRSGPGTDFPQVNRYAGGCTLGFDGYCIGDPVAAKSNGGYYDDRWLIVHRRHNEFVSSAELFAQSPSDRLGPRPATACAKAGGFPLPSGLLFHISPQSPGVDGLSVSVHGASMVGYSIRIVGPTASGDDPYSGVGNPLNILQDGVGYAFSGHWNLSTAYDDLPGTTGEVDIAAEVCLALGVPYGRPSLALVRFARSASTVVRGTVRLSPGASDRLAQAACAGPD